MENWHTRLIKEQAEVKERFVRLVDFINSEEFYTLSPNTVRITGAVECFHTDALTFDSLYQVGIMQPIIVDNAVDIDTEEQLNNIK